MLEKIRKDGRLSIIFLIVAALFISSAAATTVSIGNISTLPGGTAIVPLMITGATGVGGAEITITFDPAVVDIINTTGGNFDFPPEAPPNNRGTNYVTIQVGQISTGLIGDVKVADITLQAIGTSGQSTLAIESAILQDMNVPPNNIPVDIINGTFTISQPPSGVTLSIGSGSALPGGTTIVPLMITGADGVGGAEINITFDPAVVDIVNTTGGDFDFPPEAPPNNRGPNYVIIQVGQISTGLSGIVKVADITLQAIGTSGQSSLTIESVILQDMSVTPNNIPVNNIINGIFTITGEAPANGTIAGKITNESMLPIANATVTADGQTVTTDDNGNYTISIAPGMYNVTARATGYVTNSTIDVQVTSNATTTVNFTLTLSQKGDLDDDGNLDQADEDLLREVVLGEREGDSRFDLNHNGINGDIGDLIIIRRTLIGEI